MAGIACGIPIVGYGQEVSSTLEVAGVEGVPGRIATIWPATYPDSERPSAVDGAARMQS